jgi:hypothetical protein
VTDNLARSGNGTASVGVDDAGDLMASAKNIDGVGPVTSIPGVLGTNDADMFRIHLCDPANFSASTVGGTTVDTQLFLFRADGTGIVMDDDTMLNTTDLQSSLSNTFTSSLTAGDYYLAISQYDKDPETSANDEIWLDQAGSPASFRIEHAPDGPGLAGSVHHWDTITGTGGTYTIAVTGVSGEGCPTGPTCDSADFDCDGDVGTDFDIQSFFSCLGGNCPPAPCANDADFDNDGDVGTDFDIQAFFRILGGGPC